jgi:exo-1,4-beta-D-glucosaminidase
MTYEAERAMFEAYRRNAPAATGVIQWMLNNAWPGMIWHLYDYYLRPGGGYFGTKKANEPIHVMYSYDNHSIVVMNDSPKAIEGATVSMRVLNVDGHEVLADRRSVTLQAGARATVATVPPPAGASPVYFLDLRLTYAAGALATSNVYWLGTTMDALDFSKANWYVTPATAYADFTALATLPPVSVTASLGGSALDATGRRLRLTATIRNTGSAIAFFVRLQIKKGPAGEEVLPVRWDDNYVTLLPGETRTIAVELDPKDLGGAQPSIAVAGWNLR